MGSVSLLVKGVRGFAGRAFSPLNQAGWRTRSLSRSKPARLYICRLISFSRWTRPVDVVACLIRMSAGNFRLLSRLLTQIERILKVNDFPTVSKEIVAAARDSLLISQG